MFPIQRLVGSVCSSVKGAVAWESAPGPWVPTQPRFLWAGVADTARLAGWGWAQTAAVPRCPCLARQGTARGTACSIWCLCGQQAPSLPLFSLRQLLPGLC